jgi:hypothetical protein
MLHSTINGPLTGACLNAVLHMTYVKQRSESSHLSLPLPTLPGVVRLKLQSADPFLWKREIFLVIHTPYGRLSRQLPTKVFQPASSDD